MNDPTDVRAGIAAVESEIRGHDAARRNIRDLPSRIADPARLRALAAELRTIAEAPVVPVGDDPRPVIRGLETIIALHDEKQRRLTVQMATVLEAAAQRIADLELALLERVDGEGT